MRVGHMRNEKKTTTIFFILGAICILILLGAFVANAHTEEEFAEAEELIKSKGECDELNNEQLELIGEYYMEQMHPGEAHERMDVMMGGEGSESLQAAHINMARSFYCGEHGMMSPEMMNVMMGQSAGLRSGRTGGGMMNMML